MGFVESLQPRQKLRAFSTPTPQDQSPTSRLTNQKRPPIPEGAALRADCLDRGKAQVEHHWGSQALAIRSFLRFLRHRKDFKTYIIPSPRCQRWPKYSNKDVLGPNHAEDSQGTNQEYSTVWYFGASGMDVPTGF